MRISVESDDVIPVSVLPPIAGFVLTEAESTPLASLLLFVHEVYSAITVIAIKGFIVFINIVFIFFFFLQAQLIQLLLLPQSQHCALILCDYISSLLSFLSLRICLENDRVLYHQ